MTLVDSSVILDVFTQDRNWFKWSCGEIKKASAKGSLIINPIIYSEITVFFDDPAEVNPRLYDFRREPLPYEAAWWAAKAFIKYRKLGGTKLRPLPDFFIGAHAYVKGYTLLTRDLARVQTYFPSVRMVHPSSQV